MASSGSNGGDDGIAKRSVVKHYLSSVMEPPKTLRFKEGVLLVEDIKAPKVEGSLEERVQKLEDDIFRYRTVVERSLDAHSYIEREMEKKVEAYEGRIKDLEEKHTYTLAQLDRF